MPLPELLLDCNGVANAGTAVVTKAVVARAVVLLPAVCVTPVVPVGREGVPEKVGEASGARVVSVGWTWS